MTTHEIPFNVPTTDPAAFAAEWEEWNNAVNAGIPLENPDIDEGCEWADLCDIVKAHEESLTDDEVREYERQALRFDNPYEME